MLNRFHLIEIFLAALLPMQAAQAQNLPKSVSPWQIEFAGPRGVGVAFRGVPIIRRSSLYVVKPGWAGLIFDQRAQKHTVEKREDGTLHIQNDGGDFDSQYDLKALDNQTFEMRFRGELRRDIPAEIELAAGYFNANLIANRHFKVQKKGEATWSEGMVPAFPQFDDLFKNDLAPHFERLQFDSRIGKIEVSVQSNSRIAFADARRDSQNWAKEAPVYWCGWMAGTQPLRFGTPATMTLRIRVDAPSEPPTSRPEVTIHPQLRPIPDAFSTREKPLDVVPRPQKMTVMEGAPYVLSRNVPIHIAAPRGETRLRAALQKMLREEWNISGEEPRESISGPNGWCRVSLGKNPPEDRVTTALPVWSKRPDSYHLRVSKGGISVESATARGVFYGIQTLAQLLRPQGATASAAQVEIEDYPALQFRGAHWFPSASGVPFHKKLIGVMARAKMNTVVIQCEAARWDSHPEIAAANSISKKDLRELVALCRANFIEPIPLLNTPGHAEWMFRGGNNLDLAEDPQTPYAYAVGNPKTTAFIHQVLGEAIEVFQPAIFHIGHDEVTLRGKFPNPDNTFYRQGQSATDLVMQNLVSLHAWLGAQNIKTMVWSDMFLHPDEGTDAASAPTVTEAQKRRHLLPKDVIIADWHYGGNEKYPSLELFAKEGLQTVATTWNTPQNIRYFSRAVREEGALGLLQTTWAGYFPDATTLDTQLSQFTAFILAGDYAWSGRQEAPDALPYDVVAKWNEAYAPQKAGESAGKLVDLREAAAVRPENWLGLGAGRDLSALFSSKNANRQAQDVQRLENVKFQLPPQKLVVLSSAPGSLAPAGALGTLNIDISARAAHIDLLHATLWSVPDGVTAAKMIAIYADGTRSDFEFKTGRTIASWQSDSNAVNARRGWSSLSPEGRPLGLRITRWDNPFPEKALARLSFLPVDQEAGYVLAGVTLVDK